MQLGQGLGAIHSELGVREWACQWYDKAWTTTDSDEADDVPFVNLRPLPL
jgi:hypothetical protein